MSIQLASQHAAAVASFVRGDCGVTAEVNVSSAIGASWRRCMLDYALDPARDQEPFVLDDRTLQEYRARHEYLIQVASAEIDWLYEHIAMSGCALLLTDAGGIVLYEKADPSILDTFRSAGLRLGADWSEPRQGTNGMGTCIAENRPIIVHRDEHFRSSHIGLSCTAAPIHEPDGSLVAVLDASSMNPHGTRESQMHVMALVHLSAKLIEKCLLVRHVQRSSVPHSQASPRYAKLQHEDLQHEDPPGNLQRELLEHGNLQHGDGAPRGPDILQLTPSRGPRGCLTFEDLAGEDPQMLRIARSARRVAASAVSVMIHGATGTGKELFARALHDASGRAPFVALNCAAIPESLIESELFGYKSGAFTGARREGMKGIVLQASGGTLFLDEIGDMPLGLQTRLLRVLEEREVVPLGADKPMKVDLRVVCASHQNLRAMIARGSFREDLYYRLNGITLELPCLAERSDKEQLIRKLLSAETGGRPVAIAMDAFQRLLDYGWPGNIRELRNVIRTALAICDGGVVRLGDLLSEVRAVADAAHRGTRSGGAADVEAAYQGRPLSPIEAAERQALVRAIRDTDGNMARAAIVLQVSRSTLYRRCRRLSIVHRIR